MGNSGGNSASKKPKHKRQSSSTSDSPFGHKANEFSSHHPTEQQARRYLQEPNSMEQGQYRVPPPGLGNHAGSGRGRGWSHARPATQFPPGLGPYGQQYQQPVMMSGMYLPSYPASSFGMYQPMNLTPSPVGVPGMPQPSPFYGGQQQQYRDTRQGSASYSEGVQNFRQNKKSGPPPQQPDATRPRQASIQGGPRSRAVSRSSNAPRSPCSENQDDPTSKFRKEFEAGRSFADDHTYIPKVNGVSRRQK